MKLTIRSPYKGLVIARKIRAVIDLVRPATLVAPIIGGTMAALMGLVYTGSFKDFDILKLFFGVIALVILNGASNSFNQVTDYQIDKVNKPYRPLPKKVLSLKEAMWISIILYILAGVRALFVSPTFFLIVVCLVLLTLVYSAEPFRLKNRLWLNNINIAVARGGLGLLAGWAIFTPVNHVIIWACALVITLYLVGMTVCKDFNDIIGDRKYGSKTLPVVYGKKVSMRLNLSLSAATTVLCFELWLLNIFNIIGVVLGMAYFFSSLSLIVIAEYRGTAESTLYENSWPWVWMYFMIGISYIIFFAMVFM